LWLGYDFLTLNCDRRRHSILAAPQQKPNISKDGRGIYPFNLTRLGLPVFYFHEESILNYCAQQCICKIGARPAKNSAFDKAKHFAMWSDVG
jgi:hypothetical protein